MVEIKFTHTYDQNLYEKAKVKFDKMLDNETGQKFFIHLVKAFIQSNTLREVEKTDDPSGLVLCDLTKTKLATKELFNQFKTNYKIKVENFPRFEGESDESYERRRDAFILAYRSSSPYACDAALGFTADKTDKVLCIEAYQALLDKYNEVASDPKYAEIMKALSFIPRKRVLKNQGKGKGKFEKPKKFNKNQPRVYSTDKTKPTLGDSPEFAKLKGQFSDN